MSVSKHAVVGVRKTAAGEDFLNLHPLFGTEGDMPKTSARLRELADQVNNGLITADEADQQARNVADEEFDSLDPKVQDKVQKKMDDGFMQQLISIVGDKAADLGDCRNVA